MLKNPLALQDDIGATQALGWLGAWQSAPSAYAVAAENSDDIVAAVNFAREHNLRLVVKGTGHDYLGRSSAPKSLLVWTHKMRRVAVHDAFVGAGCSHGSKGIPAVTVQAGTRWLEAYQEVTTRHGRYVQGGGCTSVGAAGGFLQGGGFGSWSNQYGMAAAGMLEVRVVTADGQLRVANACQNTDLFWALRGGGGGTFGVVTEVTLMTHPAPRFLGFASGTLRAQGDSAFQDLIERFVAFYRENLANANWGERVAVKGNNSLEVNMSFVDMTAEQAERVWRPFLQVIKASPDRFSGDLGFLAIPGERMWDHELAQQQFSYAIVADPRPGESGNLFWWVANQKEVAAYWYAYQSRWIPRDRFEPANAPRFARTLFEASRKWTLDLDFHKAQASASKEALLRDRETSVNPAVYRAAALVIIGASGDGLPGVAGHEPNLKEGEAAQERVSAAMKIIRDVTPGAGTYVNEADYFEPDWQHSFWGEHYERLLQIKRKYDPKNLFTCHHCVGSE